MFDNIQSYASDDLTVVRYLSDDVSGTVRFHQHSTRTTILSSIGPDAAIREDSCSYHYSSLLKRWVTRTSSEVIDLATKP